MVAEWERVLERWQRAGLITAETAGRIRAFEAPTVPPARTRWPAVLLLAAGAVLLGAGVLLFVAAHWDALSPGWRFASVLALVAAYHVAGAVSAARFDALAVALHGVGTVTLGAGIYLAAQVFHLREHWPSGVLLWAVGAWMGVLLRRDWVQMALAALVTPAWLAAEWTLRTTDETAGQSVLAQGVLLLAITYLGARAVDREDLGRRALAWMGGLALFPAAGFVAGSGWVGARFDQTLPLPVLALGLAGAYGAPLALAAVLRGRAAMWNGVAAVWVLGLARLGGAGYERDVVFYLWAALGAAGLVAWGVAETRRERVNLGMAAFLLTVGTFYFSNVMDKLGRSASLIGLGVLCLVGGALLESARRWLLGRLGEAGRA